MFLSNMVLVYRFSSTKRFRHPKCRVTVVIKYIKGKNEGSPREVGDSLGKTEGLWRIELLNAKSSKGKSPVIRGPFRLQHGQKACWEGLLQKMEILFM